MRNFRRSCFRVIGLALLCAIAPAMGRASEPVELDRGIAPHNPQQPQVAVDAHGSIHVVYGVGDPARHRRSDDGCQSFT